MLLSSFSATSITSVATTATTIAKRDEAGQDEGEGERGGGGGRGAGAEDGAGEGPTMPTSLNSAKAAIFDLTGWILPRQLRNVTSSHRIFSDWAQQFRCPESGR